MKKLLAIGASSSSSSINRAFATYAANRVDGATVAVIDLSEYDVPVYSIDHEESQGIPKECLELAETIAGVDGIVISMAEHNGSYTAAFKSVFDWMSRHRYEVWAGKPMLLLSASPGEGGAKRCRKTAEGTFERMGAKIAGSFSLPNFDENFSQESGIQNEALSKAFSDQLSQFCDSLFG